MIDVSVKKKLGTFTLDAELHDAGFICLSGRNGSGKSSLLKIMAGINAPDEGTVSVNSNDVTALPMERRRIVLVTPDSFIPHLPVDRHLRWGASARKRDLTEDQVSEVKSSLGIDYGGRLDRLSLGMRERVSLATALLSGPDVLLVDEAFANLHDREEFMRAYQTLCARSGIDVVFTTQNEADSGGSDHHYSMDAGTSRRIF